jgi:hypothetical protein
VCDETSCSRPHGIIVAPVLSAQQHHIKDRTAESCKEINNGDALVFPSAESDLYQNSNNERRARGQSSADRLEKSDGRGC